MVKRMRAPIVAHTSADTSMEHGRTGRTLSLSALALVVLFGITAYSGANIILFERLEGRVAGGAIVGNAQEWIERVSDWKNTAGVAMRARSVTLDIVLAENPDNGAAIENALDMLIEASPTSVGAWQAWASFQKARGGSMDAVLAAFRMSALTGSHEGYFMMQRAAFGLEHWNEMPEMDRRIVVRDLLATATLPELGGGDSYRRIIAAKSQAERDDIRAALMAFGSTKAVLQSMGL